MTSDPTRPADFDTQMRAVHQAGLQALPAPTLARLRAARQQASRAHAAPSRRWGWLLAAVPALLGAALGVHLLLRPAPSMPTTTTASVATATATATTVAATASVRAGAAADSDQAATAMLDENPDLYLWLGSDTSLAME
ncbi:MULTISPECIES: hypothetical protein [Xanthomonas]|uniref:DUF3619 domain-containing protein n=1 Tax=Xanthomonas sacchari TaxID=56458 RepID=A0ABT3E155_9XANT|nr:MULTISPECIES: hypothetical protein [Xanthomonas]KAB7773180.1 hypothetical protein CEK65_19925 [Xanthomonas sp. LMG 12459]MCW0369750.1 hypothetical protein [Xanthomonas sacchari]MCW0392038.1 hypothetical protein [Xanthomonas sacchari]MCW0401316.1 hypothetical protein [Xanthomonas sacchari]MCW0420818.1 hypothetical protein [Xanthomonas sacchari]